MLRRFAPYDGAAYEYVGEGEIPEYMLLQVGKRAQRALRAHFEEIKHRDLSARLRGIHEGNHRRAEL